MMSAKCKKIKSPSAKSAKAKVTDNYTVASRVKTTDNYLLDSHMAPGKTIKSTRSQKGLPLSQSKPSGSFESKKPPENGNYVKFTPLLVESVAYKAPACQRSRGKRSGGVDRSKLPKKAPIKIYVNPTVIGSESQIQQQDEYPEEAAESYGGGGGRSRSANLTLGGPKPKKIMPKKTLAQKSVVATSVRKNEKRPNPLSMVFCLISVFLLMVAIALFALHFTVFQDGDETTSTTIIDTGTSTTPDD